jgi:signal peptidase II
MIWAIIIILIVAIDQGTKQIVASKIPYGEIYPVIDKFFYITYHENKGAAWGILQNGRIFFIFVTLLVSSVIIYAISKSRNNMFKLSLAIILGGALGNFIDRVVKGGVGDFLDFYIFSYHFPTFNAADISIVIGTALLAVFLLFIYKEPKAEPEGEGTDAVDGADSVEGAETPETGISEIKTSQTETK